MPVTACCMAAHIACRMTAWMHGCMLQMLAQTAHERTAKPDMLRQQQAGGSITDLVRVHQELSTVRAGGCHQPLQASTASSTWVIQPKPRGLQLSLLSFDAALPWRTVARRQLSGGQLDPVARCLPMLPNPCLFHPPDRRGTVYRGGGQRWRDRPLIQVKQTNLCRIKLLCSITMKQIEGPNRNPVIKLVARGQLWEIVLLHSAEQSNTCVLSNSMSQLDAVQGFNNRLQASTNPY